jgi:hypothetical protein
VRFDTILANKIGKKPKSEDELIKSFADMTPDLVLWASDDVLNLYSQPKWDVNRQRMESFNFPKLN